MKIPKKITPDRIRDSFVEVRYESAIPFEAAVGVFYKAVEKHFQYSNRPLGERQFPISGAPGQQEITVSLGGLNLFHNDKIKIQLQRNSIVFNCLEKYLGWDDYKSQIQQVMNLAHEFMEIRSYSRLGIRYVSEYPNQDIGKCVKFDFTFGMPEIKSDSFFFRSEFKSGDYNVILQLSNKLPIVKEIGIAPIPISIIDLDVISTQIRSRNPIDLMNDLDLLHAREKEIFFTLLREDFLTSLKPEYS